VGQPQDNWGKLAASPNHDKGDQVMAGRKSITGRACRCDEDHTIGSVAPSVLTCSLSARKESWPN